MDIVTYAKSKKYTDESILGTAGVIRGKNCKIKTIEEIEGGNKITFEWTADDGSSKTSVLVVKDAPTIESIEVVARSGKEYFKFTFSDGSVLEDTEVPVLAPQLQVSLQATNPVGSVTSGKTYAKGTSLETIIRDMLIKTENPVAVLTLQPDKTVYDIVNESITSVTMKANVTKKTYNVSSLKFYVGSNAVDHKTNVATGGNFSYTFNTSLEPIKETTTFKIVAEDEKGNQGTSSVVVNFVAKSYYGIVGSDVGAPTASMIKALNGVLKTSKGYTYKGITCDYNKVVYAYPKSMGALSSIKDIPNNINYTSSFSRTEIKVDNIDYYCYTQTDPSGADGVELTFA